MKRLGIALVLVLVLVACGDDGETGPKITFDGEACNYEGPTSFALETVEFVVLNDSDRIDVGFSVWRVPNGTTLDDIVERGMLEVGIRDSDTGLAGGSVTFRMQGASRPGTEYLMPATFEIEGTHAADCWTGPRDDTTDFPAIVFEVE
jgi:hypothetical protein